MNAVDQLGYTQQPPGAGANSVQTLSKLWAKKYVQKLIEPEAAWEVSSKGMRTITAQRLLESLRSSSAQAWTTTEKLLSNEVKRHGINYRLIDPWEIAKDAHGVYEQILLSYAAQANPQRLCFAIASALGSIRQKYTAVDCRIIGFVSLQFHYTGQLLLKPLPRQEQVTLSNYFKIIDDHLYMPLQRAYNAAAKHDYNSPALEVVRQWLPAISEIAERVAERVSELNPNYYCRSGKLDEQTVKTSSIRDIEMFQIYLLVCILENSVAAIHHELFPLCVMLYPMLKVQWELVRQMLHLIGIELRERLTPPQQALFMPYLRVLWEMFSPEIFPESLEDNNSENVAEFCCG
ncbi:MAG TPA: hypothetical protein V6C85_33730 [Allocoleopsis sp.]